MNAPAIVGRLTLEETAELLGECIAALPEAKLFEALEVALSKDQKAELAEGWFEPEEEGG